MDPFFAALIAVGFMGVVFVVFGVVPGWLEKRAESISAPR
jgi:hypothetical protein